MCPDCRAEQRLVKIAPNVAVMQIFHDDTCPWQRGQTNYSAANAAEGR